MYLDKEASLPFVKRLLAAAANDPPLVVDCVPPKSAQMTNYQGTGMISDVSHGVH